MADAIGQPTSPLIQAVIPAPDAIGPSKDGSAPVALAPPTVPQGTPAWHDAGNLNPLASFLEYLIGDVFRWDFFAVVRQLEALSPQRPRIGYSNHPNEDVIRFGQQPSMLFAAADLARLKMPRIQPHNAPAPLCLLVNFFGLLGANGPMPLVFTDYIRNRHDGAGTTKLAGVADPTLAEFLDIFHHRLLSLYYCAWSQASQAVQFDRHAAGRTDRFADYIGSLCGMGTPASRQLDDVDDIAKLYYAGLLQCQNRHADGLEAILHGYFEVPVEIREFIGEWVDIPERHRCRMDRSSRNMYLGNPPFDPLADLDSDDRSSGIVIGSRIWTCRDSFRIRLGPLNFEKYQRMLPGAKSLRLLIAWVRQYVGDSLKWDVQLILRADSIPDIRLGRVGRLGWSTWLHAEKPREHAQDLVIKPELRIAGGVN